MNLAPGTELRPVGRPGDMTSITGFPGTADGSNIPHPGHMGNSGPALAFCLRRSQPVVEGLRWQNGGLL